MGNGSFIESSSLKMKKIKKHVCSYEDCAASFARPSKLDIHVKTVHLKESIFKCTYPNCDKDYTQAAHLKRHIQLKHESVKTTPSTFVCNVEGCLKKFEDFLSFRSHCNLHHSAKYSCMYCRETFCKRDRLIKHLFQHTGQAPYVCEECGLNFIEKHLFNKHVRQTHRNKLYKCTHPNCTGLKKFSDINLFRKHMSLMHQTKYTCAHCDRQFSQKWCLEEHIVVNHNQEKCNFTCTFKDCNRVFRYKRNLDYHIKINHLNINYQCPIKECRRILCTKQKFQEHMKVHETLGVTVIPPSKKRKKSLAAIITKLTDSQEKLLIEKMGNIKQIDEINDCNGVS